MANFNENRTWGIEIEFKNTADVNITKVISEINAGGVPCYQEGYNHNDQYGYWKKVTDSSVTSDVGGYGHELVSPPLKGEEGFRQLKVVCDVFKANGVKIDKSCGLHVHHDAHDFAVDTFKKLFALYVRYEGTIDSMMPASRRGKNNTYCDTMRRSNRFDLVDTESEEQIQSMLNKIKKCQTVADLRRLYNQDRYHKLNIEAFVRHGTIEFRQHSGTIDYEKISNWIMLTNMMITKCLTGSVQYKFNSNYDTMHNFLIVLSLIKSMNSDPTELTTAKYIRNRVKQVNKEAEVTA